MIILSSVQNSVLQPIVIIDYTRSDEQFSDTEIYKYAAQLCSSVLFNRSVSTILKPKVFSLNYNYIYEHNGMAFGDAKRTQFSAEILNAPNELVGLLQIREIVSKLNIQILANELSQRITDSEVRFPVGGIVCKDLNGNVITRPLTVYSTPYMPDRFRLENKLILEGGSFEDVVLRLNSSANIDKNKALLPQLQNLVTGTNYTLKVTFPEDTKPTISKYYEPAPLNVVLQNICRDNKLTYRLEGATYIVYSLVPEKAPQPVYNNRLSFLNGVQGTKLISNMTLSNYAIANIESELFNVRLFETIAVYDDLKLSDQERSTVFYNLNKISELSSTYDAYQFYVLGYKITDSRYGTTLEITGSNNWLLNNIKLDMLFEPAIYKQLLAGSS